MFSPDLIGVLTGAGIVAATLLGNAAWRVSVPAVRMWLADRLGGEAFIGR